MQQRLMRLYRITLALIALVLLFPACSSEDPQTPQEVIIGNQIWMTRNLDVTHFRNGDLIPEASSWDMFSKETYLGRPAYIYDKYHPDHDEKYGKLYNWWAVVDERGLGSAGWRVPSDSDWLDLRYFLGGAEIAGEKLKSTSGWADGGNGTNESGFEALPGGLYMLFHGGSQSEEFGFWWSTSEWDETKGRAFLISSKYSTFNDIEEEKELFISVRLVKDVN